MAGTGQRQWDLLRQEAKAHPALRGDVQTLAGVYVAERIMDRLMRADRERLVTVKGGHALGILLGNRCRPTKDIDVNFGPAPGGGLSDADAERAARAVEALVRAALAEDCGDGVRFDLDGLAVHRLTQKGEGGLRLSFAAHISSARIPMQIDVGFGNEVTFAPTEVEHVGLLSDRKGGPGATVVRIYPIENTVAEKLAAKVEDGELSIRHKDFFDLWLLCETVRRLGDLRLVGADPEGLTGPERERAAAVRRGLRDGTLLALPEVPIVPESLGRISRAVRGTFARRGTELAPDLPDILRREFSESRKQCREWVGWVSNNAAALRILPPLMDAGSGPAERMRSLPETIARIEPFVAAACRAAAPEPAEEPDAELRPAL